LLKLKYLAIIYFFLSTGVNPDPLYEEIDTCNTSNKAGKEMLTTSDAAYVELHKQDSLEMKGNVSYDVAKYKTSFQLED